jgi:nitroreductase
LIESGAAMQSVYLAATELGVPIRAIGGIDDARTPALLGLPESSVALLALIIG